MTDKDENKATENNIKEENNKFIDMDNSDALSINSSI